MPIPTDTPDEAQAWLAMAEHFLDTETRQDLPLTAYTGHYDSPRGGPIEIREEDGRLRLNTLVRHYTLDPWHAEVFALRHADWKTHEYAHFQLTPAGRIDAIDAFGIRFERVSDTPEGAEQAE